MVMPAPAFYTAEMVRALPYDTGIRYETVYGELLVTPSPRRIHQEVLRELFLELGNYLRAHPEYQLFSAPADISWSPDTLVQPDLFVTLATELSASDWSSVKTLLLAVEILSPATLRQDRFTKRHLYQQVGVKTSWFVDCDTKQVEIWTPEATFPVFEREMLEWAPAPGVPSLLIEVPRLFRQL